MNSIRRQLTMWLLGAVLILASASGIAVYYFAQDGLVDSLDRTLIAKARMVTGWVTQDENARVQMENDPERLQEFSGQRHGGYFEIWDSDGTALFRSPSLRGRDLPRWTSRHSIGEKDIPALDGYALRAIQFSFTPDVDGENEGEPHAPPAKHVTIVLAGNREELNETLGILAASLLSAAAALSVGTILSVTWAVRRGLRPLQRLGREVDAMDAVSLERRFSENDLPAELLPIARRLNGLLDRLHQAFARERRFTADVAHELRTPIAELKSMAEIALKWPDKSAAEQHDRDSLDIAVQMESLVTALLDIARCEAGAQQPQLQSLDVNALLHDIWGLHLSAAEQRGLKVGWQLTPSAVAQADRHLLLALLDNLFSNAVTYAAPGGTIVVATEIVADRLALSISNPCDNLDSLDLPHLFEPFWRKDPARTGGLHCGLGLSVVAAYAAAMGIKVDAHLPEPKLFRVVVTFSRDKGTALFSPRAVH
jgi:signal transduction histidine kinase